MLTWIGRSVALLLLAQEPLTLEQDRQRTKTGFAHALITLIAVHEDGSPVRGYIQCSGVWGKHQDGQPEVWEQSMPFRTDARGAIVMNPTLTDEWMTCWSSDKGKRGQVTVEFDRNPVQVVTFVLDKESE